MINPPLSAVIQPSHLMGEIVSELLLKQIELKNIFRPETVVVSGTIKIQESSVLFIL